MRSNQPDELDKLLDEALASYSSEEPRPGLEQRVLGRVRAAGTQRRFGWWRWAVAIPVLASLLVVAITHRVKPQATIAERTISTAQPPATTDAASAEEPQAAAPRRRHRVVTRPVVARSPLPRLSVFPRPSALSPEERALVDLVARFPDQAREVLIEADQRSAEPIEIRKIQIPPLTGGS
ncbi:MAG: hypothetical protein LAQ69_12220 [Acidobacteriia bacterium]|nr:hypothetical protein [Terriglobia bacterium]